MTVQTFSGPVDGDTLGTTLIHEHIVVLFPDYRADYPWDAEAETDHAVEALKSLAAAGVSTLVDMTVIGLGRSIARTQSIVERVPELNVVAATGIYAPADLPSFFRNRVKFLGEDWIGDFFVREISEGIGESGVHAGVVKLVTDEPPTTEDAQLVARQVARAHLATGVPIITHSHAPTQGGLVQQDMLEAAGVDLGRVVVGHVGDSADLDYLERLIDRGSWLGMDRFGHTFSAPLEQRIDVVAQLCQRGYADRLLLSHDTNVRTDSLPDEIRSSADLDDWHYLTVTETVLPALRDRGVSDDDIETMMVENPRRVLEPSTGDPR